MIKCIRHFEVRISYEKRLVHIQCIFIPAGPNLRPWNTTIFFSGWKELDVDNFVGSVKMMALYRTIVRDLSPDFHIGASDEFLNNLLSNNNMSLPFHFQTFLSPFISYHVKFCILSNIHVQEDSLIPYKVRFRMNHKLFACDLQTHLQAKPNILIFMHFSRLSHYLSKSILRFQRHLCVNL